MWVFICAALFYLLLLIPSYFLNVAIDNGRTISYTEFFVARLFVFLRYPFWLIRNENLSVPTFLFAAAINTFCYALVIERLIYFLFGKGKPKLNKS